MKTSLYLFIGGALPWLVLGSGYFFGRTFWAAAAVSIFVLGLGGIFLSVPLWWILVVEAALAALSAHRSLAREDSGLSRADSELAPLEEKKARAEASLREVQERKEAASSEIRRWQALYEITKQVASETDIHRVFHHTAQFLKKEFHAKRISLYLKEADGDTLRLSFAEGERLQIPESLPKEAQGMADGVWLTPLFLGEVPFGCLMIERDFANDDFLRDVRDFADHIALGLAKAKLYAQVEERSRTDGLTGALRRGALMERLAEEILRARRKNGRISVCMVDLDHFKKVNDTYGHQAGDEVLKAASRVLKESLYETDILGRYGGEEFLLVLLQADPEGVVRKLEATRERIAALEIPAGLETLRITASFGLAHFPKDGSSAEEIISRADGALYQAKSSGRNRVVSL